MRTGLASFACMLLISSPVEASQWFMILNADPTHCTEVTGTKLVPARIIEVNRAAGYQARLFDFGEQVQVVTIEPDKSETAYIYYRTQEGCQKSLALGADKRRRDSADMDKYR